MAGRGWPDTGLVIWFRPDVRREIWAAWRLGFALVTVAALLLGVVITGDPPAAVRIPAWVVGSACLVAGPILLFSRLQRALAPERVLSVHQLGLRWRDDQGETAVRWQELAAIVARDDGPGLAVTHEDGRALLSIPYDMTGMPTTILVALLNDYHRKALLGVPLRAPRTEP